MKSSLLASAALLAATLPAAAGVFITEVQYNGSEFIEFTNYGTTAVDFTGWSFDDDSRVAGTVDLSAFGLVAAGESVLLAEMDAAAFRAEWSLSAAVKVIGGNGTNLGRNDEINLFDANDALVDRLAFGDQNFPGSGRFNAVSGWTLPANLGTNNVLTWLLATPGDAIGSVLSVDGDFIGNPGVYFATPIPEPSTYAAIFGGLVAVVALLRRRRA